jgi:hypothetical protein
MDGNAVLRCTDADGLQAGNVSIGVILRKGFTKLFFNNATCPVAMPDGRA